jgi:hypothetical protein
MVEGLKPYTPSSSSTIQLLTIQQLSLPVSLASPMKKNKRLMIGHTFREYESSKRLILLGRPAEGGVGQALRRY